MEPRADRAASSSRRTRRRAPHCRSAGTGRPRGAATVLQRACMRRSDARSGCADEALRVAPRPAAAQAGPARAHPPPFMHVMCAQCSDRARRRLTLCVVVYYLSTYGRRRERTAASSGAGAGAARADYYTLSTVRFTITSDRVAVLDGDAAGRAARAPCRGPCFVLGACGVITVHRSAPRPRHGAVPTDGGGTVVIVS